MHVSRVLYVMVASMWLAKSESVSESSVQVQPVPQQQPQAVDPASSYIGTYNSPAIPYYEAGYGVQNPSVYDYMMAHNYPVVKNDPSGPVEYMSGILPVFKVMTTMLKAAGRVGLFLLGAAGVLLVGMAFTTAVCTLTPLCTITFFNGYGLSEQTVRALLTPDKITATAHFVQDALKKYQQMQDAINDP